MAYFEELPEISYISRIANSNRNEDRILVKNIFKRAKLRTDIESAITAFNYFQFIYSERILTFFLAFLPSENQRKYKANFASGSSAWLLV